MLLRLMLGYNVATVKLKLARMALKRPEMLTKEHSINKTRRQGRKF